MSRMFGDRINEFVLSVDIMNEDTFHDLLQLVSSYLHDQLDVTYFAVLEEGTVDGKKGLTTLWSSRDARPSFSVESDNGSSSFSAFSFGQDCPLWVVSAGSNDLSGATDYVNRWKGGADVTLPAYRPSASGAVQTSVMHPLRRGDRPIGVLEFGCSTRIEPTPASLVEVKTLADTIARAYRMFDVRKNQKSNTERALRLLEDSLVEETWKRLALPQIFVAYSGRADSNVVQAIRDTLARFSHAIKPHFWEDSTASGDINSEVIANITTSEFGVCYFSEPSDDGYIDNANVLFEAGMMQALTNSGGSLLRGWIPIREEVETIPFDVAAERSVVVARNGAEADIAKLVEILEKRIETLVGVSPKDAVPPLQD